MSYVEKQKNHQNEIFSEDERNGEFNGKIVKHVLQEPADNFYDDIDKDVKLYFNNNKIHWWGGKQPTGNTLSSQIACINHLFPIKKDKDAVLSIAKQIDHDINNVVELENDKEGTRGFISFEVVSKKDHLNETKAKELTRGSNCTSIDAVIMAEKNGKKCLLVIEWKYTESYSNVDKSEKESGKTRLNAYTGLINKSTYLRHLSDYKGSVYFHEPFYQLMRQTLWAEQVVENANEEILKADSFIHVHVIPEDNTQLLNKEYKCSDGKNLEETWNDCLTEKGKKCYKLITPERMFEGLKDYEDLKTYLKKRYW